jgi:hypothetical protein
MNELGIYVEIWMPDMENGRIKGVKILEGSRHDNDKPMIKI